MSEAKKEARELKDLLCCPSCKYTEDEFKKHQQKWSGRRGFTSWDDFRPISYCEPLGGKWVIECQNCRMAILFGQSEEGENIELWNELPRNADRTTPKLSCDE